MECTSRLGHEQQAELESLLRIAAVRDVCEAFLAGHWHLDAELLAIAADVLGAATTWAATAEQLRPPQAA